MIHTHRSTHTHIVRETCRDFHANKPSAKAAEKRQIKSWWCFFFLILSFLIYQQSIFVVAAVLFSIIFSFREFKPLHLTDDSW